MKTTKRLWIAVICTLLSVSGFAQSRTGYFNDNLHLSNRLNPAVLPTAGYFSMPVLGMIDFGLSTDFKNFSTLIDAVSTDEGILENDEFYNSLKTNNQIDLDLKMDILSFGWWKGKNFWSVNVGLKFNAGASLPKSLLDFARESARYDEGTISNVPSANIENVTMKMKGYTDIGVGYSRRINDKFTVGGRAKVLLGWANVDLGVDNFELDFSELPNHPENPSNWDPNKNYHGHTSAQAHIRTSYKGGGLEFNPDGSVKEFALDGFGVAGYGVGFDLGITYMPINRLTLSAAVQDLGFIKWQKGSTSMATADHSEDITVNIDNYEDYLSDDVFDLDKYELQEEESKGYTTGLGTTLMVGGEYRLGLKEQFSVGALYTTRFAELRNVSTFSAVAGYVPASVFNASLSYTYMQYTGSVIGGLIKLGSAFIGADYAFAGPQASYNFYIGMSFKIGERSGDR